LRTGSTGRSLRKRRNCEAAPGAYKLLANKYYVDEMYGATVVKPLLGFSRYVLGWWSTLGF